LKELVKEELEKVVSILVKKKNYGALSNHSLLTQYILRALGDPTDPKSKVNETILKLILETAIGKAAVAPPDKPPPPTKIVVEFSDSSIGEEPNDNQNHQDQLPAQ